ncbi:hypothetical protein Tco_0488770 [Tanacetum coccineum]
MLYKNNGDVVMKRQVPSGNCKYLSFQYGILNYINLDNELRSIKIGKMTVNEYCTKIQSMANRLKNLDCQVSKKNLVIYAVNGLDSRFATLAEIIRHREPLPTFEMDPTWNMDTDATDCYATLWYNTSSLDDGMYSSLALERIKLGSRFWKQIFMINIKDLEGIIGDV